MAILLSLIVSQMLALRTVADSKDPMQPEDSKEIIEHIIVVFQNANELPDEKVRQPAIQQLTVDPQPTLTEIRAYVVEILDDSRNEELSPGARLWLQNIVVLIDRSVNRARLTSVVTLRTNTGGDFIGMRHPYSLIDGYAQFAESIVQRNKLDSDLYIDGFSAAMTKNS